PQITMPGAGQGVAGGTVLSKILGLDDGVDSLSAFARGADGNIIRTAKDGQRYILSADLTWKPVALEAAAPLPPAAAGNYDVWGFEGGVNMISTAEGRW